MLFSGHDPQEWRRDYSGTLAIEVLLCMQVSTIMLTL